MGRAGQAPRDPGRDLNSVAGSPSSSALGLAWRGPTPALPGARPGTQGRICMLCASVSSSGEAGVRTYLPASSPTFVQTPRPNSRIRAKNPRKTGSGCGAHRKPYGAGRAHPPLQSSVWIRRKGDQCYGPNAVSPQGHWLKPQPPVWPHLKAEDSEGETGLNAAETGWP